MRDEFGIEDFLGALHEYTLRQFCRDAVALGGGIFGDLSIARGGIVGDLSIARGGIVGDLSIARRGIVGDPSIALIAPLQLHIRGVGTLPPGQRAAACQLSRQRQP